MTIIRTDKTEQDGQRSGMALGSRYAEKPQFDGTDLIRYTVEFWRWKAGVNLSEEEAKSAIGNASGFIDLLLGLEALEDQGPGAQLEKRAEPCCTADGRTPAAHRKIASAAQDASQEASE